MVGLMNEFAVPLVFRRLKQAEEEEEDEDEEDDEFEEPERLWFEENDLI